MKELKDIVLKEGDRVYFSDGDCDIIDRVLKNYTVEDAIDEKYVIMITKIERPHYETIYEAPKQILDKEEKEYLENVIRPFRDRVKYIKKIITKCRGWEQMQFISITIKDEVGICLPYFKKDTMYKGMEVDKEYTLKELGLFE